MNLTHISVALFTVAMSVDFLAMEVDAQSFTRPYSASSVIERVEFDFTTHRRLADGSDNWPTTWADDGQIYTAWGDGGGFGGTNSNGHVTLGVARLEGEPG